MCIAMFITIVSLAPMIDSKANVWDKKHGARRDKGGNTFLQNQDGLLFCLKTYYANGSCGICSIYIHKHKSMVANINLKEVEHPTRVFIFQGYCTFRMTMMEVPPCSLEYGTTF